MVTGMPNPSASATTSAVPPGEKANVRPCDGATRGYPASPSQEREADMARKVTVALEDDLDGGPAHQTVRFALNGADYEIDLSGQNATAFRE